MIEQDDDDDDDADYWTSVSEACCPSVKSLSSTNTAHSTRRCALHAVHFEIDKPLPTSLYLLLLSYL